jgi:hypothetical protein
MAATSTNKQPLLVDRVLHYVVNLDTSINDGMDIVGTNTASLIVDGSSGDGAVLEDVYSISRGIVGHKINLYISSARDYLRPNEAVFVGSITCGTTKGDVVRWEEMPKSLTPVPQVGDESFNRAFYLPRGLSLWAARESSANLTDGPLLGCQGGWY